MCEDKDAIVVPENIVDEECECYTSCEVVDFKEVVGSKTVKDGGIFGDLLAVARANIEDSKKKSELTESAAGEVYAQAIVAAMKESVSYSLAHGKVQKDIALVVAQTEYQHHKIDLERDQYDLDDFIQRGKLSLEQNMTAAQIRKIDQDIRVMVAQIRKIDADIIHLDHQNAQIDQAVVQSKHEVIKIDASVRQIEQEIRHSIAQVRQIDAAIINLDHQNNKIDQEIIQSKNTVYKINAETRSIEQEIIKSKHQVLGIDAETAMTYQRIEQSKSEINKNIAAINQMACQCINETNATDSKIALNSAQVAKLTCDCENSTKLIASQAALYNEQAAGFRDNARQKLFETQVQSYSMVFEAAEVEGSDLPSFLTAPGLQSTYNRIDGRVF